MPINKEYVPIHNQPTIKPRTVTGIFTNYIAKTLPLAFDESMSYYECLCALLEYLNETIVPDINNTNEGLSELQTFYEELQTYVNDYFKNLDVQEEINNKLDEMVEDGVLEQIIEQFIQSTAIWCFDTVADMKLATNLINGSYAKTLGYYSLNDGGGAIYKIRQITNDDVVDEMTIISVYDNLLIAELIYNNEINPLCLGAKANGTDDDTTVIEKAISLGSIINGHDKTYKMELTIDKSNIEFKNFKINGYLTFNTGLRFININNCEIDATGYNYGINASSNVTKLYIDNVYIHNATLVGLNLIDCWDSVLTRLSLSSNGKGFYASSFNHGVFEGTCYGNDIGAEIYSSASVSFNATIQENKKTGLNLKSIYGSTFELYLEQNGYEGTTYQEQSQLLVGDNESRCLGNTFNIYAMGGSGSEMESQYGATFLSAMNCVITGRFERHVTSGIRIGSAVINCQCNVVDVNHTNYGYDNNLQYFIYKLGDYTVNTNLNIPESTEILYRIKGSTPMMTSVDHNTSSTTIIRAKDSDGNTPNNIYADVYVIKPTIITSLS